MINKETGQFAKKIIELEFKSGKKTKHNIKNFYMQKNDPYGKNKWLSTKFKELKNDKNKIFQLGLNLEKKYKSKNDWTPSEKQFYESSINYISTLSLFDKSKKNYSKGSRFAFIKLFKKDSSYAKKFLFDTNKKIQHVKYPDELEFYNGVKDTINFHLNTLDEIDNFSNQKLEPSYKNKIIKIIKNYYNDYYKKSKNLEVDRYSLLSYRNYYKK